MSALQTPTLSSLLSNREGNARPYLDVNILGEEFRGLLDSGTTRSILGSTSYVPGNSRPVPFTERPDGSNGVFGYPRNKTRVNI